MSHSKRIKEFLLHLIWCIKLVSLLCSLSILLHYLLVTSRNAIRDPQRVDNNSQFLQEAVNVSMNFPIDTIPSSYEWSMLRTFEWLSISSWMQLSPLCYERHLRVSHVFSCLFRQLYINQCKFHMIISFQDHHPLVQHVLLCTTSSSTYEINY